MHIKEPRTLYLGRVGVIPGVSGSRSKHPCLQVSSGLQATVIKFTYKAALVSLPEIYINRIITDTRVNSKNTITATTRIKIFIHCSRGYNEPPGCSQEVAGNKRPFEKGVIGHGGEKALMHILI